MEILIFLFGQENELNALQMMLRAIIVFLIALGVIRLSGRRSFGIHAPFDNTITILLGAILSRSVVGASPFLPTILACVVISILHRLFALLSVKFKKIEKITKGKEIILFQNGNFNQKGLNRALISTDDILGAMRLKEIKSFDEISLIYMERNGNISFMKKL